MKPVGGVTAGLRTRTPSEVMAPNGTGGAIPRPGAKLLPIKHYTESRAEGLPE
jgi:hypothetical protein